MGSFSGSIPVFRKPLAELGHNQTVRRQVSLLRKVLAHRRIRVLIAAVLPRAVGIAEVDVH